MAISQHLSPMVGTRAEVRSAHGVVSAGHPLAVEAGLGALEHGGNAIDAVVAGAFAAFVAEPNNAGIGGYGHLSAFLADDASFLTVDHGPRAPARARGRHVRASKRVRSTATTGHRCLADGTSSAISRRPSPAPSPGFGRRTGARAGSTGPRCWSPRSRLAETGLEVTWVLLIEIAARLAEIEADPTLAAMLLPQGRLPRARTADDHGRTSEPARAGRDACAGSPARDPTRSTAARSPRRSRDAVAAGGGILSAEDLARYAPKVMHEQPATYRGLQLVTADDTVGYEALGILEHFPLSEFGPGSVEHYHLLAEAMGHAFADNASYACDPDFTDDPVQRARRSRRSRPPARPRSTSSERRRARSTPRRRGWRPTQPRGRRRSAACTAPPRSWPATARATWPR